MRERGTGESLSESTEKPSSESSESAKEATALAHEQFSGTVAPYGYTRSGKIRQAPRKRTAADVSQYEADVNARRVDEVMVVIRALQFRKRTTVMHFAKKWGTTASYASYICQKAIRLAREELTDADAIGATVGEALFQIVREGMASKRFSDRKIVIEAAKQLTMLAPGLRAPTEHIVKSGGDNLPDDPAELIKLAQQLAEKERVSLVLTPNEDGVYVASGDEDVPGATERGTG